MDFDFNIILVPLTLTLGLIWLADKLFLKERKVKGKGNESIPVNWAYDFFPVLAVVLIVRSFIIEPFNIPSSSMVPTLYTGDFITVNKSAYGIRLPLFNIKVLDTGSPEHGDVAVFRFPEDPKVYYIKRIIGLPGDKVSFDNGRLSINGEVIVTKATTFSVEPKLLTTIYPEGSKYGEQVLTAEQSLQLSQQEESAVQYAEEKQGKHTYLVRDIVDYESSYNPKATFLRAQSSDLVIQSEGKQWEITVPAGQYFVMGDNRDRSADSRFWGLVPDANLAGRASYIWMHKKPGFNFPSFDRNGQIQ